EAGKVHALIGALAEDLLAHGLEAPQAQHTVVELGGQAAALQHRGHGRQVEQRTGSPDKPGGPKMAGSPENRPQRAIEVSLKRRDVAIFRGIRREEALRQPYAPELQALDPAELFSIASDYLHAAAADVDDYRALAPKVESVRRRQEDQTRLL